MVSIESNNRFHLKRRVCAVSLDLALFLFCICGIVGVLIDADHLEDYLHHKAPLKIGSLPERTYHIPMLYVAFGLIGYSLSLIGRLYVSVLKKVKIPNGIKS